jgi:hypothetical protein
VGRTRRHDGSLLTANPSRQRRPGGQDPRSRTACALRMGRREMLGERQVAAPLMAQCAAHGALRPAHCRLQPGEGVGVQLAGFRLSGKPQRPSQCQFGHETLVLACALIAPAAPRPGKHCAMRRQRGRQAAPCGHSSTVGQWFLQLVPRDDQGSGAEHPVQRWPGGRRPYSSRGLYGAAVAVSDSKAGSNLSAEPAGQATKFVVPDRVSFQHPARPGGVVLCRGGIPPR